MKRTVTLLLCAVMLLSVLAGCAPTQEELLVGTWKGTADLASAYETMLAGADPAITGHINIQNFTVELTLRFREDGTYSWSADEDQLRDGTERMMDAVSQGLSTYLQAETGMSAEQVLAASGKTMEELMAEFFDPDMVRVVSENLCSEGTYEIKNGKLTLVNGQSFVIFEGDVELDEESLKLKNGVATQLVTHLMPLTFERD